MISLPWRFLLNKKPKLIGLSICVQLEIVRKLKKLKILLGLCLIKLKMRMDKWVLDKLIWLKRKSLRRKRKIRSSNLFQKIPKWFILEVLATEKENLKTPSKLDPSDSKNQLPQRHLKACLFNKPKLCPTLPWSKRSQQQLNQKMKLPKKVNNLFDCMMKFYSKSLYMLSSLLSLLVSIVLKLDHLIEIVCCRLFSDIFLNEVR